MELKRDKIECDIINGKKIAKGMMHLIEIIYNEDIVFWNAVCQITTDQIANLGEAGPTPVQIRLSDGRVGFIFITHWNMMVDYVELAGVGSPNPMR